MLTDQQRAILDFERQWYRYPGAKDQAVRERFGMTPARYSQVLLALIDEPDAEAYDVVGVRRLKRLREGRRGVRSSTARPQATGTG